MSTPEVEALKKLQRAMQKAFDDLNSWLLDNTENVFEEIPEIDQVRTDLNEALEESYKVCPPDKPDCVEPEITYCAKSPGVGIHIP